MGENSGIAWTDDTFNCWWGCTKVSPGCDNCYAESWSRRVGHSVGGARLPIWGAFETRRAMSPEYWKQPERWNRQAAAAGVRRRVFCASMADVFEAVPDANRDATAIMEHARERLWPMIESTPWLDWLLLTKRPQNIGGFLPDTWQKRLPPNVWLGTTAEDQKRYDQRWSQLGLWAGKASVLFVSYEPALGPMEPNPHSITGGYPDWLIIGGESGPGARPFAMEWAERMVESCRQRSIKPFVKQLGAYVVSEARTMPHDPVLFKGEPDDYTNHRAPNGEIFAWRAGLKDAKGGNWDEWPEHLRVREFPEVRA